MTTVEEDAQRIADEIRADLRTRAGVGTRGAIVVKAVAGAGKSTFISETVAELTPDASIIVGAATNEQVYSLVRTIAAQPSCPTVHYVPAEKAELPFRPPQNVIVCRPARQARGARLVIGTLHKIADAFGRGDLSQADCLIIDEAYQANAGIYYDVAEVADVHLLVGDAGQIDPFSTVTEARRFKGLAEDPVRTAVDVLLDNHSATRVYRFPVTRRLDARAVPAIRAFYETGHAFDAVVPTGVRELEIVRGLTKDARLRSIDSAIAAAGKDGWSHLELPATATLQTDPDAVAIVADTVARALAPALNAVARCERFPQGRPLTAARVAVGVSHNDQRRTLRKAIRARGHSDVTVLTANKLQGLEYDLVVCLHPLSGLPEADGFHLEAGRLCVLATRHRQACIVVGRASDRQIVTGVPPSGEAWLGCDAEPVLSGWEAHKSFYEALEPHRRPIAA